MAVVGPYRICYNLIYNKIFHNLYKSQIRDLGLMILKRKDYNGEERAADSAGKK